MRKLTTIDGPATIYTGSTARFRVGLEGVWNEDQKGGILWLYGLDDEDFRPVDAFRGPYLSLIVGRDLYGRALRVKAYTDEGLTSTASDFVIILRLKDPPYPEVSNGEFKTSYQHGMKHGRDRYSGSVNGRSFSLGHEFKYGRRLGIGGTLDSTGPLYSAAAYARRFGRWAWLLEPTLTAEGRGCFTAINTYDAGRFSFGLVQFASHTPNDNFVLLLRDMLRRKEARYFFPSLNLKLIDGQERICLKDKPLENSHDTIPLCNYLNPDELHINAEEVTNAARLVYWVRSEPELCDLQVDLAVASFKRFLREQKGIDGQPDTACAVIADIRNQGRGTKKEIEKALKTDDPYRALLEIDGEKHKYRHRVMALEGAIARLWIAGHLGSHCYNATSGEFERCKTTLFA